MNEIEIILEAENQVNESKRQYESLTKSFLAIYGKMIEENNRCLFTAEANAIGKYRCVYDCAYKNTRVDEIKIIGLNTAQFTYTDYEGETFVWDVPFDTDAEKNKALLQREKRILEKLHNRQRAAEEKLKERQEREQYEALKAKFEK